jgi:hypothetical protein
MEEFGDDTFERTFKTTVGRRPKFVSGGDDHNEFETF